MCIPIQQFDRKGRVLFFIANMSLVIGLLLWNFREYLLASNPLERDLLHAVCGFLLGLSITINLSGLIRGWRSRGNNHIESWRIRPARKSTVPSGIARETQP